MKALRSYLRCPVTNRRIRALTVIRFLSILVPALLLTPNAAQAQVSLVLEIPPDLPALARAWDVAIDSAGNIYVSASGQIVKLNPAGEELMRVSLPDMGNPAGIDLDEAGNIYVADSHSNCVRKYDSSGTLVATFGSVGSARGLAVDRLGHVYLGDRATGTCVNVYTTSGDFVQTLQLKDDYDVGYVEALAVDDGDNLYVLDAHRRILIFDSGLELVRSFSGGDAGVPVFSTSGLDVDGSGAICVADKNIDEVLWLDATGHLLRSASFELEDPRGLVTDQIGNLYVTEYSQGSVKKLDSSGGFLFSYGTFGTSLGRFSRPQTVALDRSGNIYVADLLNRIQKFSADGDFLLSFNASDSGGIVDMTVAHDTLYVAHMVTGTLRVSKFDLDGALLGLVDDVPRAVRAVASDDWDNVYFLGVDDVIKHDPSENPVFSLDLSGYDPDQPDIAADSAGNIYFVAAPFYGPPYQLFKYDSGESLITTVIDDILLFARIDTDSDGNLYLARLPLSQPWISVLDPGGLILFEFGAPGGGPGEFANVSDIAVSSAGTICVADSSNQRVAVFARDSPPGDLDHDGDCDMDDRTILLESLRTCEGDPAYNGAADYDDDECITFNDYRIWYSIYKATL